jgi:hypothetical protein
VCIASIPVAVAQSLVDDCVVRRLQDELVIIKNEFLNLWLLAEELARTLEIIMS